MALPHRSRYLWLLLSLVLALPAVAETPLQSPNDDRQYEAFTLPNQMKVLVISDPTTDKAAASLDVFVGSSSDPKDREGLAHFLEHMLFLGTEKYPEPDAYHSFISAHGGNHNAYTAPEHTNYFFNVDSAFLQPALDRFGQFFVAPLFNARYVEREMNAVNSEYQAKRKEDGWRNLSAFKQAINPAHPYAQFAVGSLDTLADRPDDPVRDDLIAFYNQHYSANLMSLVVLGKEPLPELKAWVTAIFTPVRNIDAQPLATPEPLFRPDQLPARLDILPVKEERSLSLIFPIPSLDEYYLTKPMNYIGNLLGHEGKGSLLSLLKAKGWSEGLSAGTGMDDRNATTFGVYVQLTEEGLQHVDEIAEYVFQYLRLIGEQGIAPWIFDEQKQLAEIQFRFQEKTDPAAYVRYLAAIGQVYPVRDLLRGPYAMEKYDPELIRRYLAKLTPANALLSVSAPGLSTDNVEKWFEAPYRISPLPADTIARWQAATPASPLALPEPNPFIPENLALKAPVGPADTPERLLQEPGLTLWFDQDEEFGLPRADFYFTVRSPLANANARAAVLTELYVRMVSDELGEFSYPATLADLQYSLYKHIRGFAVRISGYSDKQDKLLERIAATLVKPDYDPARFARLKAELLRDLRNAKLETPYEQAMGEVTNLLLNPYWTEDERITALEPLTPTNLQAFVPDLLKQVQVVALAHGNVAPDESKALTAILTQRFLADAQAINVPRGQLLRLNDAQPYVREIGVDHHDSALAYYFQGIDKSYISRARFGLLAQMMKTPFFQQLRTEQQLGYIVFSSAMPLLDVPGLVFVVQSPTAEPLTLENRIEDFLKQFGTTLASMPREEFERQKQALLVQIMERDQQLSERTARYWQDIDSENYAFDTREQLAQAVADLNPEEMTALYNAMLLNAERRRLVIRSTGTAHKDSAPAVAEEMLIDNLRAFKDARTVFPG